jgi:hypothetical protein
MIMYDRDTADVSGVTTPQVWPEAFSTTDPSTWGRLHFGPFQSTPPGGTPQGTTVIRAATPDDNTVEDSWMGGGGDCSGGHNGKGETNRDPDPGLFVASQVKIADFPCFSKSYLRFSLVSIPAGKAILSATMTLYHWGNANPSSAQPSWVHLYTIADPWGEMTIHWNNAPLAKENVAATWINPRSAGQTGPADPYNWDVTQAVIEAYGKGQPLNVAIYSSDSGFDSSKYLVSSENFNTVERPKLVVTWGTP